MPNTYPWGATLPLELRRELLDPIFWREPLERYARVTGLAVALTDPDGGLLGEVLNPQPLWSLLRVAQRQTAEECPFSLVPRDFCLCVAAAGYAVLARDRTGLVHFAVPLALGGCRAGALVAGQVFDHFPEQLLLEYVAKDFDVSPARIWHLARLERPVSRHTLYMHRDLLTTYGAALLQARYLQSRNLPCFC